MSQFHTVDIRHLDVKEQQVGLQGLDSIDGTDGVGKGAHEFEFEGLDWLQQVCDAFSGDASVIFYYAGHGIPDEASGSAYLLPTDGNSRLLRTCFGVNELYETLGKLPAKKVMVLMDACFSGAKRNGGMLASARGVAIKTRPSAPKGSMIVLSAARRWCR